MPNKIIVEVDFLDHCSEESGIAELVACKCVGYLVKEDEKHIVICAWLAEDDFNDCNTETLAILKHPGMTIKRYKKSENTRARNRSHFLLLYPNPQL